LFICRYELLFGRPPFYDKEQRAIFRKIVFDQPLLDREGVTISDECKSLIQSFMDKDQKTRLGSKEDYLEVRKHPFFKGLDFQKLLKYELKAPLIPDLKSKDDVDHFDSKYTNERPKITLLTPEMVSKYKDYDHMFQGFYYDEKLGKDDWKVIGEENEEDEENQEAHEIATIEEETTEEKVVIEEETTEEKVIIEEEAIKDSIFHESAHKNTEDLTENENKEGELSI